MNSRKIFFFIGSLLLVTVLSSYSGCGEQLQFSKSESLSSYCSQTAIRPIAPLKVMPQVAESPFKEKKVRIFGKVGTKLLKDSKYVFLIDSSCVEESADESFARKVFLDSGKIANSKTVAVPYYVSEDISLSDFEAKVNSDKCIIGVTPPGKVQKASFNDPYNNLQKHIPSLSFEVGYQAFFTTQYAAKTRVKLAVIDTGIDCTHPDLKCWTQSAATGFPDVVDSDHDAADPEGHGTNVAGIAAAISNNKVGVTGLSGNLVDLLAVRVIGPSGGNLEDVYNGVQYAINSGVDVINMSFGAVGENDILRQAVDEAVAAGIFVVMAAGNDSCKFGDACTVSGVSYPVYKYMPGYVGDLYQGAVTVGSVDISGYYSSFANYHPTKVEIAAFGNETPDDGIYSTWKGKSYQREKGTSQATPQVAAAAALLISFYKTNKISYTMASLEADILSAANKDPELASLVNSGRIIDFALLSQVALGKLGKTNEEIQSIICKK